MATRTCQETAIIEEALQGGETEMYWAFIYTGAGGESNDNGGYGFEAEDGGPPSRNLS